MVKYCGMEVGKEITPKQVERLFNFLHKKYSPIALIQLTQEQLNIIAQENKEKWF